MALLSVWYNKKPTNTADKDLHKSLIQYAHIQPTKDIFSHIKPKGSFFNKIYKNDRPVSISALCTPTTFYSDSDQIHIDSDYSGALVFNGYVFDYSRGTPKILTARELYSSFSIEKMDELAGEYALVHISTSGKITAISDLEGLQNLFYVNTDEVIAFSTRPSLLARICNNRAIDITSLLWISAIGYRVGDRSSYEQIKSIPQGQALIWDGCNVSLLPRHSALARLSGHRGFDIAETRSKDQLEKAVVAASCAVQIAAQNKEFIELPITGGKDSRVILSLCLASGLKERLRLFTRGPNDHPDVVVGKMLAEAAGVPHRTILSAPPSSMPCWTAEEFLTKISSSAYQVDGLVGVWDLIFKTKTGKGITLSGGMGEILKAYAKRSFQPNQFLDPITLIKLQAPFDPMGILTPQAVQELKNELESKLMDQVSSAKNYDDLPDIFYYTNRIPNWLGTSRQVGSFAGEAVMPLGVPPLMHIAFAASAAERKMELIHYSIVQTLTPYLTDIPFARQQWHNQLKTRFPKVNILSPINMPPSTRTQNFGSWQYSVNHNPRLLKVIYDLIADNSGSNLWSVINKRKLLQRVSKGNLSYFELISLLGILPSLMFDIGFITPRKLLAQGSALSSDILLEDEGGRRFIYNQKKIVPNFESQEAGLFVQRRMIERLSEGKKVLSLHRGYLEKVEGLNGVGLWSAEKNTYEIESVQDGTITLTGWVQSVGFPNCRLAVEVLAEGAAISRVPADQFRGDLKKAGIGDGKHGFVLEIAITDLLKQTSGKITVKLKIKPVDTDQLIAKGNIILSILPPN